VPRRITVRVLSADRPGLLAKITKVISAAGLNIDGARVTTTPEKRALQLFDLSVSDARTLGGVMKEIERIKGVLSVERVRA
jgi:GTP pyrophosphokinase